MKNNHIVYAAFDSKGNCLYVGEGKPDRYKHITSGVSHVYEANKWHFANKQVVVKILHEGLTKEQALAKEKLEINSLRPAWNKCEYGTMQLLQMCNFVSKEIKSYTKINTRHKSKQTMYTTLAKDLCKLLDTKGETTITQGQSWNSIKIPNGFMSHLAKDGYNYYAPLKHLFEVVRDNESQSYSVKLKNWLNQD